MSGSSSARVARVRALHDEVIDKVIDGLERDAREYGVDLRAIDELKRVRVELETAANCAGVFSHNSVPCRRDGKLGCTLLALLPHHLRRVVSCGRLALDER